MFYDQQFLILQNISYTTQSLDAYSFLGDKIISDDHNSLSPALVIRPELGLSYYLNLVGGLYLLTYLLTWLMRYLMNYYFM